MLEENRTPPPRPSAQHGADFGIAWDGDFDRCFLFDEQGGFIEGYYIVGLLASMLLRGQPGGKVVHDPRLTWNTIEMVKAGGGSAVLSKSGHAFIKQRMREVDGVYGGEMSAHHYFRRFAYCDSGMIPWLVVAQILSESGEAIVPTGRRAHRPISGQRRAQLPQSRRQGDPCRVRAALCAAGPCGLDRTDGVSFEFPDWRFNLRTSNTEPLIRLNVEARGSIELMQAKTAELLESVEIAGRRCRGSLT